MSKLSSVDAAALREELAATSEAKPAKRLMIALAYKDNVPVSTLSERYGIPQSTCYYWLDRFEELPVGAAARDEDRPGRPPALDTVERARVRTALTASPREYGIDAESWTTVALGTFLEREFDVDYSAGHVRRLRRELTGNEQ